MEQLSEDEIPRTIEVIGLPTNIEEDDVFAIFENRRIGGGAIDRLQLRAKSDGTTLITFKDEAVVVSLLSRQNEKKIRVIGSEIDIRRYEKPEPVPVVGRTVIVSEIPPEWNEEELIVLLENPKKDGGPIETVSAGESPGVSIVTFVDQAHAEKLVERGEVTFCGSTIKIAWPMELGQRPKQEPEEVVCPRSIVVENFPENQLESLNIYLESKRHGGGPLESVEWKSNNSVVATFVDEKVAIKFLEKGVIKIGKKEYQIKKLSESGPSNPSVSNTIEVSDIPETTSEEFLRMYFENEKRSGGGEIKTLAYDRQERVATITFSNPKAVLSIVERTEHKLGSEIIHVVALESLTPDLIDQVCAVRVINIPPKMSKELLTMYFEIEKRSGGDDFDDFIYEEDNHSAVIVYKSPEVCKRVANRQHQLESTQLQVETLKPRPPPPIIVGETDERKLLVSYLPDDYKDENLKLYLEKASGQPVVLFNHGPFPDLVLVDFKNAPNYVALRKLVASKPFQGQMIAVQKVKPSSSIIIRGAQLQSLSDDMITLHFENSKRSGGGEVLNIRREDTGVIILFKDVTVISKVLKTKQTIGGQQLKTELYHDCLVGTNRNRTKIQIPEEIAVSADKRVLKFISDSKEIKARMESEMKELDAAIQWQNPDGGSIRLSCTLTPGTKDLAKRVTKWETTCMEKINAELEKFISKEEEISADIWEDFVKGMKPVKDNNVKVQFDKANHKICVVGLSDSAAQCIKTADEIRNKLLAELAKRKSKTFKSIKAFKPPQLQVLKMMKGSNELLASFKELEVTIDDREVSFQGSEDDVNQAMIQIYELVNKIVSRVASNFDQRKMKFFQKKQAITYFSDLFQRKELKAVWAVTTNGVEVYGISEKDISEALSLLDSEIEWEDITLDINQVPIMKQPQWTEFKKGLEDTYQVAEITIDIVNSKVTVTSIRAALDQITTEIRDFLNQHTILEKFVPLEVGKMAYIEKFFGKEIKDLERKLEKESVVIECIQKKNSAGILVRGTKSGLENAVKSVNEMHLQVLCTTHETDIYGVQKYFSNKRGKEAIEKVQNEKKVIVEVTKEVKNAKNSANASGQNSDGGVKGPTLKATVKVKESVVKVMKGNLTECHIKALVIPIGGDMKHKEGAAKAILEAGGQMIEDECQAAIKATGILLSGQIYVSKPGTLACSGIIHVVVPQWTDGKQKETDFLEEGIWNALLEAKKCGWTSIAISGIMNFPAVMATAAIVNIVEEFLSKKAGCKMEVILIDSVDQVVNHFYETLVKKFGKDAVKIDEDQQSNQNVISMPVAVGTTRQFLQTNYLPGKDASTVVTPEGVQVTLIQGTIATQQVDVIFNTVSKDLQLTQGAVSKSILQAAGANLQTECLTKSAKGLAEGHILVTSGCSLKCTNVYHGVCQGWDGGKGKSEEIIRDLLKKSFDTAHQSKMKSIAMPALGTGNLGTPRDIVCTIMYEEVEIFSKANPGTTLKDIRFVVFDQDTVDAFQEHLKYLMNPSAMGAPPQTIKKCRNLKRTSEVSPEKELSYTRPGKDESPEPDDDVSLDVPKKTVKIKSLMMEIKQGDITQENTDAIVNSTNKSLNLTGGAVSKAIVAAGGPEIAKECKALGKTNDKGIAVTGAGKLKCKKIIHLAAPDADLGQTGDGESWEKRTFNCLKEAESQKFASIAFPLLGTGQRNMSPSVIAINILHAVGRFSVKCRPKHLKTVIISIFQPKMVDEFFEAIKKKMSEKKTTSLWGKFTGWLGSFMSPDSDNDANGDDDFEVIDDTQKIQHEYQSIFRVYGLSQTVIDEVIAELEGKVKEAVTDKVLEGPDDQEAIAKLTPEQIKRLEADAANHQVRATVEQGRKINRIRLQGDANDIADVVINVTKILREVTVDALKRNEAQRIAQLAHWEYEENDGTYESYPDDINAIIELAFKAKTGFAKWEEDHGQFKIDFTANMEENLQTQTKIKVRRIGDAPIEDPKHWEPMNLGEGCRIVLVPVGSNEYNDVENRVKATCKESCKEIIKMERIQNHSLYQQYAVKKLHMEASAGPNATVERILWHGTGEETVKQINTHGFNRSYCGKNATAFGKGVYFARDWTYSAMGTYSPPNSQGFKFIYQARVLTGDFTLGSPEHFDAPLKPNDAVKRYDSVVNDTNNPSIFVVFRDPQVYPEYLITFI